MLEYTIRPYQSPNDAELQYELWLNATASLTRAWRSCLCNVRHQLKYAENYPKSRLYAERADKSICGYIGTHPPFEWIGSEHGPPTESLGWTIPFGYPWTYPFNSRIAEDLYHCMIEVTPVLYSGLQRDIYIQRFRESWTSHLQFLEQHGWRLLSRVPLIGRSVGTGSQLPGDLRRATRDDLPLLTEISQVDVISASPTSLDSIQSRFDAGWIVHETFWKIGDRGMFVLEPRGDYAAVTVLYARPGAWKETVRSAMSQAAKLNATEVYFTVEAKDELKRKALEDLDFGEVDAGVYYVCDAP